MVQLRLHLVLLLALEEILAQQDNTTSTTTTTSITVTAVDIGTPAQLPARRQLENGLEIVIETRRKSPKRSEGKNRRSTSSSSGSKEKKDTDGGGQKDKGTSEEDSLNMSEELSTSSGESKGKKEKKYARKSSAERKGWRKWHRKCLPCPEDMSKKWKDQTIKWVCGAYQRAQRSFKSLCMMHYRNCQDGTMFTKIHDHQCVDDNEREGKPHGDHFFYTYNVVMSGDSSGSMTSSSITSDTGSSVYHNYHQY